MSCDGEDEDDEFDDDDDVDDFDKADASLDNTDGKYEKEEANNGIQHCKSKINVYVVSYILYVNVFLKKI